MFLVFHKQKMTSYLIAFSTVAILFMVAFASTNQQNSSLSTSAVQTEETQPTSSIATNEAYEANYIQNETKIE